MTNTEASDSETCVVGYPGCVPAEAEYVVDPYVLEIDRLVTYLWLCPFCEEQRRRDT